MFTTRRFQAANIHHKYAVLVAARNEETVIGNLIESINRQNYPLELITIFVVADNCTDKTAEIALKNGAVCYRRNDTEHRTKGYALQYLVECIRRDYGIEKYDGYFIFDADNLLKKDYISRMNDAFDSGEKIITSYRNTKNFADNWISASYGIHWLRIIRNEHRTRSFLRLATRIQGTGFLFANELIKDGWNYTGLTEDRAFCADAVANGYRISYNHDAEFYDEQPIDVKIAMRQRIRWAKGHLQAFAETGGKLFKHIFLTGGAANSLHTNNGTPPRSKMQRLLNNMRLRFMSFDMLTVVYPRALMLVIKKLTIYILRIISIIYTGHAFSIRLAPNFVNSLFNLFGITPVTHNTFDALVWLTAFTIAWSVNSYVKNIFVAVYIFIIEHRRIVYIPIHKKIWFCITFPIFDIFGKLALCIALFKKVEWKPVPHNSNINILDIPS